MTPSGPDDSAFGANVDPSLHSPTHDDALPDGSGVPTPTRPIHADWLTLRRPADEAAREGTQRLLTRLSRYLRAQGGTAQGTSVHVIDLGAGTGANQAWLAQRLPFPTHWTLLDHDRDLLHHPVHTTNGVRVHGGLTEVPTLLDADPAPSILTCSALLDLLTPGELDDLADLLTSRSLPALFSLTVTGEVTLVPADEDDARIATAFDAHQSREDLTGPRAAAYFAARLRETGAEVVEAATPWRLTAAQGDLMTRYLTDRVDAAIEQDPSLEITARRWLDRRLQQLDRQDLAVVVGHVDLLVLPR